jgi:hypothetical protein
MPTVLCCLIVSALAQKTQTPLFEDYPVSEMFKGTPVPPQIVTPEERYYRTVIRQGVSKGWGVFRDGKEQPGPNFAGHYIGVEWGCGTGCRMMVFVDAETGKIEYPPLSFGHKGTDQTVLPMLGLGSAEIEFKANSRLLIMKTCRPGVTNLDAPRYVYHFLWQDNKWSLLRRVRLEQDEP